MTSLFTVTAVFKRQAGETDKEFVHRLLKDGEQPNINQNFKRVRPGS